MKTRPKIVSRIIEAIRDAQRVCIVGHIRPDGDCIGSQLALTQALRNAGKTVTCWNEDPVPHKLAFLDSEKLMERPRPGHEFDCVIAVDCASLERLGKCARHITQRAVFINIDHHASNTRYADINWISGREPSTGELIYQFLTEASMPITQPIADCLFTAISTDTGSFQYASTRPSSFVAAGRLVSRGADLSRICEEVYQSYPLSRVRLMQRVLNHFRLVHHDQLGYFWLRSIDFTRTGAKPIDSEGLIDHIRSIEPVVVACMFEEAGPDTVRISLRSKNPQVDVNKIALQFGGGGHPAAAGARITGTPLSVQRRVVNAINKSLDSIS
jgi:phosphoesterase RecJ-like protein